MKYDAVEFRRYADMLAPRAAPSILADMLRCAVDENDRLREEVRSCQVLLVGAINDNPILKAEGVHASTDGEKLTITKKPPRKP